MFPGEKSAVIEANRASSSPPRIAGKFSINHGSSEGFFFARQNVNILAVSFINSWPSILTDWLCPFRPKKDIRNPILVFLVNRAVLF